MYVVLYACVWYDVFWITIEDTGDDTIHHLEKAMSGEGSAT